MGLGVCECVFKCMRKEYMGIGKKGGGGGRLGDGMLVGCDIEWVVSGRV